MKIEYPQINWLKIAKECPKALKAFYDSYATFNGNSFVAPSYKEVKDKKDYIKRLRPYNTSSYEIIMWMESMEVIVHAQPGWTPIVNWCEVPSTNTVPTGLSYPECLAVAILKGFEIIEHNINDSLKEAV